MSSYTCKFPHSHQSWNAERGGRERFLPPSRYRSARIRVCVFHKSFKLLSSHTNIPLTKKVCRLSETRRIFKENIFPQLFIYFSFPPPLAHTIPAVFICLIGADIQDSSVCDFSSFFFISCQRRRQGRGSARRSNISPAVRRVSFTNNPLRITATAKILTNFLFRPFHMNIHNE